MPPSAAALEPPPPTTADLGAGADAAASVAAPEAVVQPTPAPTPAPAAKPDPTPAPAPVAKKTAEHTLGFVPPEEVADAKANELKFPPPEEAADAAAAAAASVPPDASNAQIEATQKADVPKPVETPKKAQVPLDSVVDTLLPPSPTQQSLQENSDNPMRLPDDVAKSILDKAQEPPAPEQNPHQPPVEPVVPTESGKAVPGSVPAKFDPAHPPEEAADALSAQKQPTVKFDPLHPPEEGPGAAEAVRLAKEGPDADIGPEQIDRNRAQYLDSLIKPYGDDANRVKEEGADRGGIPNLEDAMAAAIYARNKNDDRLKGLGSRNMNDAMVRETMDQVKWMGNWLAKTFKFGWDSLVGSNLAIPGEFMDAIGNAIDIVNPSQEGTNPLKGVPSEFLKPGKESLANSYGTPLGSGPDIVTGGPGTGGGKAFPGTKSDEIPKNEAGFNPDSPQGTTLAEVQNLRRQASETALVAGVEQGNAAHTEMAEKVISHAIGLTSYFPNQAMKLFGGPQVGFINPKLQVLLANHNGFGGPIPIRSAKPWDQMDNDELAADIFTARVGENLTRARVSGHTGPLGQDILRAWNGGSTYTPEQLAEKGVPVPIKALLGTASVTNLAEGALSLGLTGRFLEATGMNSLLKASANTVLKTSADLLEDVSGSMDALKAPNLKKFTKWGVNAAAHILTGHVIAKQLGMPAIAGQALGAVFRVPLSGKAVDLLFKGPGFIAKAISATSHEMADAIRLSANDPENMLATRSLPKQFLTRGINVAKEGMIGTAPLLFGTTSPEELGSLVGMGIGLGAVGHGIPELAKMLQSRTIDSAFITDNNRYGSRKPAADPTGYGTNKDLDAEHAATMKSVDPVNGKNTIDNARQHLTNDIREQIKDWAELYILRPKAYAAEIKRMADLGRMSNPDVNSMGVSIDPNPGQNKARILVRSDYFDQALPHELSHPIVRRIALERPADLETIFQAYSRNNDPNDFTLNYTRKATQGQTQVDYDHLPSEAGLAAGTEQSVPGLRGMTKEDMKHEMAAEAVSGLIKGGSIKDLTRDPTMLHKTQQAFFRILDDLGMNGTTVRTVSPLGLKQAVGSSLILEPLVRDALRRNSGQGAGVAPDLDTMKPGFKKPGTEKAPKPEAAAPHPDEGAIKGIMKAFGIDRQAAEDYWNLSQKQSQGSATGGGGKKKNETASDIAKQGLLQHKDVNPPFTPEEIDKHVPANATDPLAAIKTARAAILAERAAKGAPKTPDAQNGQQAPPEGITPPVDSANPNGDEIIPYSPPVKTIDLEYIDNVKGKSTKRLLSELFKDPKWHAYVEKTLDLYPGSLVQHGEVVHAIQNDGKPVTVDKAGNVYDGHLDDVADVPHNPNKKAEPEPNDPNAHIKELLGDPEWVKEVEKQFKLKPGTMVVHDSGVIHALNKEGKPVTLNKDRSVAEGHKGAPGDLNPAVGAKPEQGSNGSKPKEGQTPNEPNAEAVRIDEAIRRAKEENPDGHPDNQVARAREIYQQLVDEAKASGTPAEKKLHEPGQETWDKIDKIFKEGKGSDSEAGAAPKEPKPDDGGPKAPKEEPSAETSQPGAPKAPKAPKPKTPKGPKAAKEPKNVIVGALPQQQQPGAPKPPAAPQGQGQQPLISAESPESQQGSDYVPPVDIEGEAPPAPAEQPPPHTNEHSAPVQKKLRKSGVNPGSAQKGVLGEGGRKPRAKGGKAKGKAAPAKAGEPPQAAMAIGDAIDKARSELNPAEKKALDDRDHGVKSEAGEAAQAKVLARSKELQQGKGAKPAPPAGKTPPSAPAKEEAPAEKPAQEGNRGAVSGAPSAPVDIGKSQIGFFGYPGDASWDHASGRGIGAFPHSSKAGSMISDYSAGLKLSEGKRRGVRIGQEFMANGHLYRWDDVVPEWSPVKPGYVDVYQPGHPADRGVSAATIAEHERYSAGYQGEGGQRGGVEGGGEPGGPNLGSLDEPPKEGQQTQKPGQPEQPKSEEPPKKQEATSEESQIPPQQAPEAPRHQPVTPEDIQMAQQQAQETPQGKRQSDSSYQDQINRQVMESVGAQHAAGLAAGDTRVKYDPETGFLAGTHFDRSDPYHEWLLRQQSPEVMSRLEKVERAIQERKEIYADHASAPQEKEGLATGRERKEAQKESPPENRIEKGKEMIQMAGKHILPSYVGMTLGKEGKPNTVIFGGVSPDKVNSNANVIATELGPHSPYQAGPLSKDPVAEEDMYGYFHNSANGHKGTGEPIVPTAGHEADIPEPAEGFDPYHMTKERSDFWNLAVTGSGAKLSTKPDAVKSVNAFELAKQNEGYASPAGYTNELAQRLDMQNGMQPVMVKNPENPTGPKIAKLDSKGNPVVEEWTKSKLHSGYEMLHLKNMVIKGADEPGAPPIHQGHAEATKAMQEEGLPNAASVKAGFMPGDLVENTKTGEQERIRTAAVQYGGNTYEGKNHADAESKAIAGEPELARKVADWNRKFDAGEANTDPPRVKDGFMTHPTEEHPEGRFLDRNEAWKVATQSGQTSAKKGRGTLISENIEDQSGKASFMPMAGEKGASYEQAEREGRTFANPYDTRNRYEISDHDMQWRGGSIEKALPKDVVTPLGDAIDHPALFKDYPDLKDVQVVRDPWMRSGHASFRSWEAGEGGPAGSLIRVSEDADKPTLIHEIQHWIQSHEGLTGGTSKAAIYEEYHRHAGEIEAREAAKRTGMTPEQRAAKPPYDPTDKDHIPSGKARYMPMAGEKGAGFEKAKEEGRAFTNPYTSEHRYEISDHDLKWKDPAPDVHYRVPGGRTVTRDGGPKPFEDPVKLSDLIDHPTLFKDYPYLKDTMVAHDPDMVGAQFEAKGPNDKHDQITLGSLADRTKRYSNAVHNDAKSDLIHEIQHSIQEHEQSKSLGGTRVQADNHYPDYHNNAGEIEAREAASRGNLTPEQRAAKLPFDPAGRDYIPPSKANFMPGDVVEHSETGERERIAGAAFRMDGKVYTGGSTHAEVGAANGIDLYSRRNAEAGFMTTPTEEHPSGRFVGREEGWQVAQDAKQTRGRATPLNEIRRADESKGKSASLGSEDLDKQTRESASGKASYMPMAGREGKGFEEAERKGKTFLNPYDAIPRYEISDHDMKWKHPDKYVEDWMKGTEMPQMERGRPEKLGDVLDHPQLFKDYPDAKNIMFEYDPSLGPGNAVFEPEHGQQGTIAVGDISRKADLIHEIQHWIQRKENFPGRGTNLDDAAAGLNRDWIKAEAAHDYEKDSTSEEELRGFAKDQYPDATPQEIEEMVSDNKAAVRRSAESHAEKVYQERRFKQYQNNQGEVEAREAAKRTTMTPEEREASPAYDPSAEDYTPPEKAWYMPGEEDKKTARDYRAKMAAGEPIEPTTEHPDAPDYSPRDKAYFMAGDNALPVEFAKNKDGSQKFNKKGKPVAVKIQFDLAGAPSLKDKQPPSKMGKDAENTMQKFTYLSENMQKQLSYQDKISATSQLASKAAVQLRSWMKDPEISKGRGWYSSMRDKLSRAFGKSHELFTHLLGVTSPREDPHANFLYSLEAFERLERGEFSRHIDLYQKAHDMMQSGDLIDHVENVLGKKLKADKKGNKSDAEAMARYIQHHDILPERVPLPGQKSGKLYGTHGNGILRALSERWLTEPGAPKTKNYAANLFGTSDEATIDSWAARFVRRMGYDGYVDQWRIQPKSEPGVSDYDFAFAQLVFAKAAAEAGLKPHEAQAICWFGEKGLWEKNGWMDGAGARASSLDTPFDIAYPEGPEGPRLPATKVREIMREREDAAKAVKNAAKKAANAKIREEAKAAKNAAKAAAKAAQVST